jgi:hypothetical protein
MLEGRWPLVFEMVNKKESSENNKDNTEKNRKVSLIIDLTIDDKKKRNIDFLVDLSDFERRRPRRKIDIGEGNIIGVNFQEMMVRPVTSYTQVETDIAIANALNAAAVAPGGILPPALLAMPAQLAAMQVQLAAMQAQMQAQFAAMQAQFAAIREQLAVNGNRGCTTIDHPLQPREGVPAAPLPPGFPHTLEALHRMNNAEIAPFLVYYGLVAGGPLELDNAG